MIDFIAENIIQIIGIVLGSSAISSVITALLTRRKTSAETTKIESEADVNIARSAMDYVKLLERSLRDDIVALQARNADLEMKMSKLVDENISLRKQVAELQIELQKYEKKHA